MDRRTFLRNSVLIAAGIVAADQLVLLERLTHRKVFASPYPKWAGRVDVLDSHGNVAYRLPWDGDEPLYGLRAHGIDDRRYQWARLVADGETSTVPWGIS